MSLVVMRRKLAAKNRLNKNGGTRGGISSNTAFSLAYTNTGKNLMGRTVSRAKTLPPRLRTQKYRRVDCCTGPSEYIHSNYSKCISSVGNIEKKPILQISNRNRLRRLASTHCTGDKCRDTSVDSGRLWKLSPNQYASDLIERLAALNIDTESGCYYEFKVTVENIGTTTSPVNRFLLNGKRFGLNFKVGNRYVFDVSDTTNRTHPLRLVSADTGNPIYNRLQIIGVQGKKNAKVIFTPQKKGVVKLTCTTHGNLMGSYYNGTNGITVKDSDENLLKEKKCKDMPGPTVHNSLTRGRIQCGVIAITKDVTKNVVANNASDQIRKVKSKTLNADCITSIRPFNVKKCSPPA